MVVLIVIVVVVVVVDLVVLLLDIFNWDSLHINMNAIKRGRIRVEYHD